MSNDTIMQELAIVLSRLSQLEGRVESMFDDLPEQEDAVVQEGGGSTAEFKGVMLCGVLWVPGTWDVDAEEYAISPEQQNALNNPEVIQGVRPELALYLAVDLFNVTVEWVTQKEVANTIDFIPKEVLVGFLPYPIRMHFGGSVQ